MHTINCFFSVLYYKSWSMQFHKKSKKTGKEETKLTFSDDTTAYLENSEQSRDC